MKSFVHKGLAILLVSATAASLYSASATARELRIAKNFGTLKCLQLPRTVVDGRTPATIANCSYSATTNGVAGGTFFLDPGKGRHQILKSRNGQWCLNVKSRRDNREGGPVYWAGCSDHRDQQWVISLVGGSGSTLRQLKHASTGKCLNVHRGRENRVGGRLSIYTCATTPDQYWDISPIRMAAARLGRNIRSLEISHPRLPGIREVNVSAPYGEAIGMGDLLLGKVVGDRIENSQTSLRKYSRYLVTNPCGPYPKPGQSCAAQSTTNDVGLWRGGVINYSFGGGCGVDQSPVGIIGSRSNIRQAIVAFEANTGLRFNEVRPSARADREPRQRLIFCYSALDVAGQAAVGAASDFNNVVVFDNTMIPTMRTVYHELMHAIGFAHEHQRPDRNRFVRVDFSNLPSSGIIRDNFEILLNLRSVAPYDIRSITHYCGQTASALDSSRPVMTRVSSSSTAPVPCARRPSQQDYDAVNLLYADEFERQPPDLQALNRVRLTITKVMSPDKDGGAKHEIDFYALVEARNGYRWRPFSRTNGAVSFKTGVVEESDNDINPNWTFDTLLRNNDVGKFVIRVKDDDTRRDESVDISPYVDQKFVEIIVDPRRNEIYLATPDGELDRNALLGELGVNLPIMPGNEGDIGASLSFRIDAIGG